ncbi:MAG: hypothetical protein BA873_11005 [Desulfobulbaceae bacterium C00003063]|nr:MAG: hypothetical protein BA873_11005 [Desulfobulbaceae bacterium C00003063]
MDKLSSLKRKKAMRNLCYIFCTAIILSLVATQAYAVESYGKPEDPLVAEVLGMQIRTKNPDEMQYVIMQKLFQEYELQNKIEANPEDIDHYIANLDQFMLEDRKRNDARRVEVEQQLKDVSLPAEQTEQLQSELAALESLHKYSLRGERENKQNPEDVLKGKRTVAKAFITQWMVNKALYQQYGGRIIFQQSGPEPLDARKEYLKEQQKKGAFTILEKSFEPPFWEYFVTDSKHSFYKQGSEEERRAFDNPFGLQKQ